MLVLFVVVIVFVCASNAQDPSRKCLDCICYASTKCDGRTGCFNAGPESYFCGPYQISYAYWVDAGKPGNVDHFEKCLKDVRCSEKTVVNYMNKWGQDCDGDQQVTCFDYALMHKAGRFGCSAPWVVNTEYWKQFQECMGVPNVALDARKKNNPIPKGSIIQPTKPRFIPDPIHRPPAPQGGDNPQQIASLIQPK